MDLAAYLQTKNQTPDEFAEDVRVSPNTIGRYIRGDRFPRADVMQRIVQATSGVVTPNDFFSLKAKSTGKGVN